MSFPSKNNLQDEPLLFRCNWTILARLFFSLVERQNMENPGFKSNILISDLSPSYFIEKKYESVRLKKTHRSFLDLGSK